MSLCSNCYHNKICEYKSCDKDSCSHYKNENLIYELSLEIGTPYYRIEPACECDYDKECDFEYSCNTCPHNREYFTIVKYTYRPTLFSGYESLGKFYLDKEEAERELEKLKRGENNARDII